MHDERIAAVSAEIYKRCFYVLSGLFLLDLLLKFNLFGILYELTDTVMLFLWGEALVLAAVFYTALFCLARRGIAVGVREGDMSKTPVGRYLAISALLGGVVSVSMWTLRFCVFDWSVSELRGLVAVILIAALYLLSFAFAFAVSFLSLYASYRVARRAMERELEDQL